MLFAGRSRHTRCGRDWSSDVCSSDVELTAPGVWAVGDCAGGPQFTHMADDDVRVVRDNLAGIDRTTTGRLVPFCLFTDPELARVGLSESEAERRGIAYRLPKIPVTAIPRS